MTGLFEERDGYYLVPVADDGEDCFSVDTGVSLGDGSLVVSVDIGSIGQFEFNLEELRLNIGQLDCVVEDTTEAQCAVLISELVHRLHPALSKAVLVALRTRLSV